MAHLVFDLGKTKLLSGLEWQSHQEPKKHSRRLSEGALECDASRFAEVRQGGWIAYGYLKDDSGVELTGKPLSFAALLAGVPGIAKNALFIHVEDDKAVLACLKNGVPAEGFDSYGEVDSILELARQYLSFASTDVKVLGNSEHFDCEPLSLDDVVARSTARKTAGLKKVPNRRRFYTVSLIILAILAAGAWKLTDYRKLQQLATARAMAIVDVDRLYAQNLQSQFEGLVPLKAMVKQLTPLVNGVDTTNNGWNLDTISCSRDTCGFTWKVDTGNNSTFVPPLGAQALTYSPKNDVITYSLPLTNVPHGLENPRALDSVTFVRDVLGHMSEYGSEFIGVKTDAGEPSNFAIPVGLSKLPSDLVKEGVLTMQGPWWAIDSLKDLPDTTGYTELDLTVAADHVDFKLVGTYYVK